MLAAVSLVDRVPDVVVLSEADSAVPTRARQHSRRQMLELFIFLWEKGREKGDH